MKDTEARSIAMTALGAELNDVSAWESEPGKTIRVEITITQGITFAMLQTLSDALGTERIDIEPAEPGHRYSSWPYDEGSPAKIVALVSTDSSGSAKEGT